MKKTWNVILKLIIAVASAVAGVIGGQIWGIERSGFFNGREKWAKGFENQRV